MRVRRHKDAMKKLFQQRWPELLAIVFSLTVIAYYTARDLIK